MFFRPRVAALTLGLVLALLAGGPVLAQECSLLGGVIGGCSATPWRAQAPLQYSPDGLITLPGSSGSPSGRSPLDPPPPRPATVVLVPEAATYLLGLANQERAAVGAPTLMANAQVTRVAESHSLAMAERSGSIWHNVEFLAETTVDLLGVTGLMGENVAWNTDLDDAHRRLMASPGHRSNMLDARYRVAGFGVAQSTDGRYWVTQNFVESMGGSPAPAPQAEPPPPEPDHPQVSAPVASPDTTAVGRPDTSEPPVPAGVAGAHPAPALAGVPAAATSSSAPASRPPEGAVLAATRIEPISPQSRTITLGVAMALVVAVGLGHAHRWYRQSR